MRNKQIWGRIGQIILVLLGISFITFALVMLSPGDPVRQMIAGNEDIVVSQVEMMPCGTNLVWTNRLFSNIWTGWAKPCRETLVFRIWSKSL